MGLPPLKADVFGAIVSGMRSDIATAKTKSGISSFVDYVANAVGFLTILILEEQGSELPCSLSVRASKMSDR